MKPYMSIHQYSISIQKNLYTSTLIPLSSDKYLLKSVKIRMQIGRFAFLNIILHITSGQENRINDREDPLRWPRDTLYPQKLALTSPTAAVAWSV
jgi:hypothetical protein